MRIDGIEYFVYALHVEDRAILGVDPRPIREVEAEWLAKWRIAAQRAALRDRSLVRANMVNSKLAEREIERDPAYQDDAAPLSPDEVAAPPPEFSDEDEVLRLSGIPSRGGFGATSITAADVRAVQRAYGEEMWAVEESVPGRAKSEGTKARRRAR